MKKTFGILVLLSAVLSAQAIHIEKRLDKDTVTIGERISVSFIIQGNHDQYEIIDWENAFKPPVEIKSKKIHLLGNEQIAEYRIALYDTGWVSISPFQVRLKKEDIDSTSVFQGTDSIRIYVNSLVADSATQIIGIKNPVKYPFPWIKWTGIVLLAIVIVILVIIVYKKLVKKEPLFEKPVIVLPPAHEIAFEKLSKLSPEDINSPEDAKRFHFDLTYIFREYLENRYHHNYLEKTTLEIKSLLKSDIDNDNLYHQILKILNTSDQVKFAKKVMAQQYHQSVLNKVEQVIRQTMEKVDLLNNKKNEM